MQSDCCIDVADAFAKRFGRAAVAVAVAPGRVNIIGEHTDYNDGFVMPAALDLETRIAFAPRDDGAVRIYSDVVGEEVQFAFESAAREKLPFWALYAWGVGMSLLERGITPSGLDAYVETSVPQGGGLSSSASFEVAVAIACLGDKWTALDKLDLARVARRAENRYVGTQCGIMDQYSIVFGAEGHAVMLDCRSLESRLISFPEAAALVIADTSVRHVLGESGYHERQEECARANSVLSSSLPGVKNLRDVNMPMLEGKKNILGDAVYRRARHVITENARVHEAAAAMTAGDLARLGALMSESHLSLRDDFEVSCRELDVMVESAAGLPGHFGTRMTGGGFGGCTVSLVDKSSAAAFAGALRERYQAAARLQAATTIVRPGGGARLAKPRETGNA